MHGQKTKGIPEAANPAGQAAPESGQAHSRLTTDTGYPLRIPDEPASANLLQPALPGILSARHG